MKIKKIPFPDVLKILCGHETQGSIHLIEGANRWIIYMMRRVTNYDYHFYMTWYCNDVRIWVSSNELNIPDTAPPDEANPLIREWYKKTCAEAQEVFDTFVKANFLEENNNEQED